MGTLEEIPCLFPATLAEKLCVAASHPELFSSEDFLDLVYGSISDGERDLYIVLDICKVGA